MLFVVVGFFFAKLSPLSVEKQKKKKKKAGPPFSEILDPPLNYTHLMVSYFRSLQIRTLQ